MNSQPATCGEELERPNTQVRIVIIMAGRLRNTVVIGIIVLVLVISVISIMHLGLCVWSAIGSWYAFIPRPNRSEKNKFGTFHKYGETPTFGKLFLGMLRVAAGPQPGV